MNKLNSFIFSILITGALASSFYFSSKLSPNSQNHEVVLVSRVIDGDTLDLSDGRRIRLADINAPEKNRPESASAINYLKSYENSTLELKVISLDKSGNRYVGELYSPSPESSFINLDMVKKGLVSKAWISDSQRNSFSKAEKEAVQFQRGIWKRSPYFGCFSFNLDPKLERVGIINNCSDFSFAGAWIKDESREIFTFPDSTTNFISSLTLHSGNGTNDEKNFYWQKQYIWNNDRDTAYFFDKDGLLLYYYPYGY